MIENDLCDSITVFNNQEKKNTRLKNSNFTYVIDQKTNQPIIVYTVINSVYHLNLTESRKMNRICRESDSSNLKIYAINDKILIATPNKIYILYKNHDDSIFSINNDFKSIKDLLCISYNQYMIISCMNKFKFFKLGSHKTPINLNFKDTKGQLFDFVICKDSIIIITTIQGQEDEYYKINDVIMNYKRNQILSKYSYYIPQTLNTAFYQKYDCHFSYSYLVKLNQEIRTLYLPDISKSKDLFFILFTNYIIKVTQTFIEISSHNGNIYQISHQNSTNIQNLAQNLLINILKDQILILNLLTKEVQVHSLLNKSLISICSINFSDNEIKAPNLIKNLIFLQKINKFLLQYEKKIQIFQTLFGVLFEIEEVESFFVCGNEKFLIAVTTTSIVLYQLARMEVIKLREIESDWEIISIKELSLDGNYKAYFLVEGSVEELPISWQLIEKTERSNSFS